ncbi:hypothetical protein [Paraburkholderia sp. HD33-4]|uniref:hypothetical protein n=1 Tax=Paraburkholderia sp. HD33-4 TaxID=2883242 RepID=UPI001F16D71F|nr:hypothetical protein [Paraburkholderia sp. HD33-4]
MGVFIVELKDIVVKRWFPSILPIEELLLENGEGYLTIFEEGVIGADFKLAYTLLVDKASERNPMFIGEVVVAWGKDHRGRTVAPSARLEAYSSGVPAVFRATVG